VPAAKGKAKALRYRRGRSGDSIKEEDDLEDGFSGCGFKWKIQLSFLKTTGPRVGCFGVLINGMKIPTWCYVGIISSTMKFQDAYETTSKEAVYFFSPGFESGRSNFPQSSRNLSPSPGS